MFLIAYWNKCNVKIHLYVLEINLLFLVLAKFVSRKHKKWIFIGPKILSPRITLKWLRIYLASIFASAVSSWTNCKMWFNSNIRPRIMGRGRQIDHNGIFNYFSHNVCHQTNKIIICSLFYIQTARVKITAWNLLLTARHILVQANPVYKKRSLGSSLE